MGIRNLADLQYAEHKLAAHLKRLPLDGVLWTIREQRDSLFPFVVAGLSSMAVRFCLAPSMAETRVSEDEIARLGHQATNYLLAEPIGFDAQLRDQFYRESPAFMLLRIMASQQPYHVNRFASLSRALVLFEELPASLARRKDVSQFDVKEAFRRLTGSEIADFVRVAVLASAAAEAHIGFDSGYLRKARRDGVQLPPDEVVLAVLRQISASPREFRREYNRRRNLDPRFVIYSFNPIHLTPLIRPWGDLPLTSQRGSRMISPLPELITSRVYPGIYYQLFNEYGTEFSGYFGYLFESYIGRVLGECLSPPNVISEQAIRASYPALKGQQVPDWVAVEGEEALLFECKATRFTRSALETGNLQAVNHSLRQILKGLKQLHRFTERCRAKAFGLETFHNCTEFRPIIVTPEILPGINTDFFRNHINTLLAKEGISGFEWEILAVDELEALQPHVRAGIRLGEAIAVLKREGFVNGLKLLKARTGRGNNDSFLESYYEALLDSFKTEGTSNGTAQG
jgi:hypothetical protein